ncbi:MAG: outer membrane beta-barrel protein [Muribaculaceae bacterium]
MKKAFLLIGMMLNAAIVALPAKAATIAVSDSTEVMSDSAKDNIAQDGKQVALDTLVVTAKTRRREYDKEIIYVTKELCKGVATASQMLGKIDGVRYNPVDESVSIDMETNVAIVVDGNEVTSDYARSINPKRIAKIEIMNHPEGRYAGYNKVINLILKQDYQGWDFTARANGRYVPINRHTNQQRGELSLNLSDKKWNFYFTGNASRYEAYRSMAYDKTYFDKYKTATSPTDPDNPNNESKGRGYGLTSGFSYYFNKNHSLSLQIMASAGKDRTFTEDCLSETTAADLLPAQQSAGTVVQTNESDYHNNNYAARLAYNGNMGSGLSAYAILNYNYYISNDNSRLQIGDDSYPAVSYVGDRHSVSANMGVNKRFSDKCFLGVSNYTYWREYEQKYKESGERAMQYKEVRNNLTAQFVYAPIRRYYAMVGCDLQVQHQSEIITSQSSNRTDVTPRPILRTGGEVVKELSLDAMYTYITSYPTLDQLSPIASQVDRYMVSCGNPDLHYSGVHQFLFEVNYHNWIKLIYRLRSSNNQITDFYTPIAIEDGTQRSDMVLRTLTNSQSDSHRINLNGSYSPIKGLDINMVTAYEHYRVGGDGYADHTGRTWYFDSDITYYISKLGLSARASYFLRHDRRPLLQGEQYTQEEALYLSLSRNFLGGKLWVSVEGKIPVAAISKIEWTKINAPEYNAVDYRDFNVNKTYLWLNVRFCIGNERVRRLQQSIDVETEKSTPRY